MFCDFIVTFDVAILAEILRDQRRLRVFENRFLRRIFGPKREDVNFILRILMIRIPH